MNKFWIVPVCFAGFYSVLLLSRWGSAPAQPTLDPVALQLVAEGRLEEPDLPDPELDEIARLQSELESLECSILERERIQTLRRSNATAKQDAPTLTQGLTPDEWKFSGRGTPEETVVSVLWAGASGDTRAMQDSIVLDDQILEIAERLFKSLPGDL